LLAVGLVAIGLGAGMWQSGVHHRSSYRDFEACRASGQGICVLYQDGSQAHSAAEFKKNYETQLLLGAVLLIGGVASTIVGAVLLVLRRRRAAVDGGQQSSTRGPPTA
jgi:hypothetical protein